MLGTLPVALLSSAAVARFLPAAPDTRYAVGFVLAIPTWLVAMCLAFASTATRTWIYCASLSGALAWLVFGIA
jgi:hypothetical protein